MIKYYKIYALVSRNTWECRGGISGLDEAVLSLHAEIEHGEPARELIAVDDTGKLVARIDLT